MGSSPPPQKKATTPYSVALFDFLQGILHRLLSVCVFFCPRTLVVPAVPPDWELPEYLRFVLSCSLWISWVVRGGDGDDNGTSLDRTNHCFCFYLQLT